jgi:hypothetical protein
MPFSPSHINIQTLSSSHLDHNRVPPALEEVRLEAQHIAPHCNTRTDSLRCLFRDTWTPRSLTRWRAIKPPPPPPRTALRRRRYTLPYLFAASVARFANVAVRNSRYLSKEQHCRTTTPASSRLPRRPPTTPLPARLSLLAALLSTRRSRSPLSATPPQT